MTILPSLLLSNSFIYRITLGNEIYSEGDYESKNPVDVMNGGRYEVTMKKTGEFKIKKFGQ